MDAHVNIDSAPKPPAPTPASPRASAPRRRTPPAAEATPEPPTTVPAAPTSETSTPTLASLVPKRPVQEDEEAPEAPASSADAEDAEDDGPPPVPDVIREAARLAPDHWLGQVDPTWVGDGTPPDWALMGEWRSGPDGEVGEWRANEEYRPSPWALGLPEPTDDLDAAVQLAATGYGPVEDVARQLASAEVAVLSGSDGEPLATLTADGIPVVPVFTAPEQLLAVGRLAFAVLPVAELLEDLPEDHRLYINPTGPVSMAVDTEAVLDALDALAAAAEA